MSEPSRAANRVVVTGVGISSPKVADAEAFWQVIQDNMHHRERSDAAPVQLGSPETRFKDQKLAKFQDDTARWALAATDEAIAAAGLNPETETGAPGGEIGFALGTCFGPLRWGLNHVYRSAVVDPINPKVSCFSSVIGYYGSAIGNVTIPMGFHGPSILFSNLDSSAIDAIAYAFKVVESGRSPVMVCGGADAPVPQMWRCDPEEPEVGAGCRGEGAGILVLETMEHALRRGARLLAEICGYSTGRRTSGLSVAESLTADKGLRMSQVDAVVAAHDDLAEWERYAARSAERSSTRYMTNIAKVFGNGSAAMAAAGAVAATRIAEYATPAADFVPDTSFDKSGSEPGAGFGYVIQCSSGGTGRISAILFRGVPAVSM